MSVFTDAMLAGWKERNIGVEALVIGSGELKALIERLEASEKCAHEFAQFYPNKHCLKDWRKKAGKV